MICLPTTTNLKHHSLPQRTVRLWLSPWISLGAFTASNIARLASLLSASYGTLMHTSTMQIPAFSVQRSIPGFLDYPTTLDQVVLKPGVSSKELNNQIPQTLR
ncbi:hypothetical protein HN51_002549 [Arachis hypogaea]